MEWDELQQVAPARPTATAHPPLPPTPCSPSAGCSPPPSSWPACSCPCSLPLSPASWAARCALLQWYRCVLTRPACLVSCPPTYPHPPCPAPCPPRPTGLHVLCVHVLPARHRPERGRTQPRHAGGRPGELAAIVEWRWAAVTVFDGNSIEQGLGGAAPCFHSTNMMNDFRLGSHTPNRRWRLAMSEPNLSPLPSPQIFLGFGIGAANTAVPLYLSEAAPHKYRGGLNMM